MQGRIHKNNKTIHVSNRRPKNWKLSKETRGDQSAQQDSSKDNKCLEGDAYNSVDNHKCIAHV